MEEFGLGLPPRIFGKKRKDTIFSLNALPIGGFVRLHGENLEAEITNPERAFLNKNKKIRTAIVVAGVVMNLILGVVAFAIVYSIAGIPRDIGAVRILEVVEGSPASEAGIAKGDLVIEADGKTVVTNDDFQSQVSEKKDKEVYLIIQRGEEKMNLIVTPRSDPPEGQGPLGVAIGSKEIYFPPIWQRPFLGIYYGFGDAIFWGKSVFLGLKGIATDIGQGHIPKDVAGPVGIYKLTSEEVVPLGLLALINFAGVLSVNLAIINVLPIPALDGGRLLFIGIEAVTRRRVSSKVENTIHSIGMVFLLLLLLGITILDFKRLAQSNQLPAFLEQIFK